MSKSARRRARLRARLVNSEAFDVSAVGPLRTRSGLTINPADPRTDRALTGLGNTPKGREWAMRVLHPNGEGINAVPKIPDGAVTTSVALTRVDEVELTIPPLDPVPDLWNCIVVHLPFLGFTRAAVAWDPSNTSAIRDTVEYALIDALSGIDYDNASIGTWRQYSTSKVYTKIFPLPTLLPSDGNTSLWRDNIKEIRRAAYGCTTDLNAAALTNQGRVVAGQFPPDVAYKTATEDVSVGSPAVEVVGMEFDIIRYAIPPLFEEDVVSTDPNLKYQAEAKDGLYSPARLWNEGIEFTPISESRYFQGTRSDGTVTVGQVSAHVRREYCFKGFGSMTEAWYGIHKSSTLRLKTTEILELIPNRGSLFSPFSTPGYASDAAALALVREFSRESPHHYCADMNHSNGLLGGIFEGLGNALGNLGIPIISDLAPVLGGLLGGILPF